MKSSSLLSARVRSRETGILALDDFFTLIVENHDFVRGPFAHSDRSADVAQLPCHPPAVDVATVVIVELCGRERRGLECARGFVEIATLEGLDGTVPQLFPIHRVDADDQQVEAASSSAPGGRRRGACDRPGCRAVRRPASGRSRCSPTGSSRTSARKGRSRSRPATGSSGPHRDLGEAVDPDLEAGVLELRSSNPESVQMTRPWSTIALSGSGSGIEAGPSARPRGRKLGAAFGLGLDSVDHDAQGGWGVGVDQVLRRLAAGVDRHDHERILAGLKRDLALADGTRRRRRGSARAVRPGTPRRAHGRRTTARGTASTLVRALAERTRNWRAKSGVPRRPSPRSPRSDRASARPVSHRPVVRSSPAKPRPRSRSGG